jgi:outer membrane lipoprotein SlyB
MQELNAFELELVDGASYSTVVWSAVGATAGGAVGLFIGGPAGAVILGAEGAVYGAAIEKALEN